jgi:glucose-6-phosphate 1-epimerase
VDLVQHLQDRWGKAQAVRFEDRFGGPVAVLNAAGGSAIVALQGAQVLSWQPAGTSEVLWRSPTALLGTGKAVRGGVPVCWPWFGAHASDSKKPAHGFVRAAPWPVAASEADDQSARIAFTFDATAIDPALWPHKALARLEVWLAETLTITLSTHNCGDMPFMLGEALHTYLAVSDIANVETSGLEGRSYIDQLVPGSRPLQSGPITISAETDHIYLATPGTVTVRDSGLKREIAISKSGSRSTVVWNPGQDKAARLGDLGPEGYRKMLCVETANAADDCVELAPNQRHTLSATLAVRLL